MASPTPERIIAYVDGFNLFYGMRDSGFRRYYWLDLHQLSLNLLKPGQALVEVKYFTARVSVPRDKQLRQATYLEALATLPQLRIFEGHFLAKSVRCHSCGAAWTSHEEKMTDVQIATELMADSFQDRLETAIIISADSDLVPPVRTIRTLFPKKRIIAAFPPKRNSHDLGRTANAFFNIGRDKLAKSQFPDDITKPGGYVLHRPSAWK